MKHMAIAISLFERSTDEALESAGLAWEGKTRTAPEVRERMRQLRTEGYEYVPTCDNVDAKGQCLGHDAPPSN